MEITSQSPGILRQGYQWNTTAALMMASGMLLGSLMLSGAMLFTSAHLSDTTGRIVSPLPSIQNELSFSRPAGASRCEHPAPLFEEVSFYVPATPALSARNAAIGRHDAISF